MKNSLRRFICQNPTDSRIKVCTRAHHRTLLLVSSLICRKLSSFSCSREDGTLVFRDDGTTLRTWWMRKGWCSYPLVLLLPEDVDHLTSEVCEAVLQVLHAVLGFIRFVIHWVFSHLNVQVESLNIVEETTSGFFSSLHCAKSLFSPPFLPASHQQRPKTAWSWFGSRRNAARIHERWRWIFQI